MSSTKPSISGSTHILLILLATLTLAFIVWASLGQIDIASNALGKVTPSSSGKKIQHLEGGIVKKILVKEGEQVTAGQHLVTLEPTANQADVEQLNVQIASLNIDIARLQAELNNYDQLNFSHNLKKNHPKLIAHAMQVYQARSNRFKAAINSQKNIVDQRHADIVELQQRIKNTKKSLILSKEQIEISQSLLADNLTNRYNHIDLLKSAQKLMAMIDEDTARLTKANAAFKEAESNLQLTEHRHREEVNTKLETSRRELKELIKQMQKYVYNLKRTVIKSPVSGVINQLYVFTEGGVVQPGQTLLDIIPINDRLIIDARLNVDDIGFVKIGQPATIRLASSDGMNFKKIQGRVTFISADTVTPDDKEKSGDQSPMAPYYKVRIVSDTDHFTGNGMTYKLHPGVQVSVNILTGTRSVMTYLLSPFIRSLDEIMHER